MEQLREVESAGSVPVKYASSIRCVLVKTSELLANEAYFRESLKVLQATNAGVRRLGL